MGPAWGDEKWVFTELEGRFRVACFCCARWSDVVRGQCLPPSQGGENGDPPSQQRENGATKSGGKHSLCKTKFSSAHTEAPMTATDASAPTPEPPPLRSVHTTNFGPLLGKRKVSGTDKRLSCINVPE